MKQPNKEDIMKKWTPILGSMGMTGSQSMTGPGGVSKEERERIEAEIKQKNRDGKIDSLIEGTEYKEEKVEQHPDYKPGSGGQLLYFDYTYNSSTHKKTRRSKKKKSNGGI
jgi:hypothetical protein